MMIECTGPIYAAAKTLDVALATGLDPCFTLVCEAVPIFLLLYVTRPMLQKPNSIISQVEDSGTAALTERVPASPGSKMGPPVA